LAKAEVEKSPTKSTLNHHCIYSTAMPDVIADFHGRICMAAGKG
jgi:hypothetical protein